MILAAIVVAADEDYALRVKFYDDVRAANYAAAADEGEAYLAKHPDDEAFALDVAYAELNAGRRAQAEARFRTLASSGNAKVGEPAQKQLAAMSGASGSANTGGTRGYAYAYSDYESRFADVFNGAFVRYDLEGPSPAIPYLAFHLTYDTRSGAPGVAQIYNDNAAVFNGGVRFPIGTYGYGFFEAGYSAGLRRQPSFLEDRYGFAYSRDYGTLSERKPHALLNGSIADYSRFAANIIGYGQASYDVTIAQPLRAIAGGTVAFDTHRLYYNNYAEGYAGLVVRGSPVWYVRAVALTGTYTGRGVDPPSDPSYRGYRVLAVFGADLK
ncbi:MAG TPA: hypothetical protein VK760_14265 [Candidatus Acidoferrales bacterium]|nr:hypothetical protein [Candidatus Acidoferrales bacterium]